MKLEEARFSLNLDRIGFDRKPTGTETAGIMNRLADSKVCITIKGLERAIERGQSFTPALKEGTKGDTWKSQQVFAIDIDNQEGEGGNKRRLENPLASDDAIMWLDVNGIDPALVYHTFSNKPGWERYRIVIALEEPLTDAEQAADYRKRLTWLMNQNCPGCADSDITDAARLVYGGKPGCVFYRGSELTPLAALDAIEMPQEQPQAERPAVKRDYEASDKYILEALQAINPAALKYGEWLKVGTALKTAGFDVSVWDEWSKNDSRYKPDDCIKRWKGLTAGKATAGTIIQIAKGNGWEPSAEVKAMYREEMDRKRIESAAQDFGQDETESPAAPQNAPEQPTAGQEGETAGEPAGTPTAAQEAPADAFEVFMQRIQTEAYRPVKTGMDSFDKMLYGGIPRQALVMLTAAPGAGKTTFCQQVFEKAASRGVDVEFFNLEMSREQLFSRSLSRIIHQLGGSVSQMDAMRGYKWNEVQRDYVERAADIYRQKINPHMNYNSVQSTDLNKIMEALNKAAERCKKLGRNAPVCVLDYLHLVTEKDDKGRDLDSATVIKDTVKRMKDWAIENNTYVFMIGANNRTANSTGKITLQSGRDTSAIEYSADIQLSLNYRALHEKRMITVHRFVYPRDKDGNITGDGYYKEMLVKATPEDPDVMEALQRMPERDMIVQCLKARMIPVGGKLYLRFTAADGIFTPIANPFEMDELEELEEPDFIEVDDDEENPFIEDEDE